MRRDLSRACSSCRLRFSAALSRCPACGGEAMSVGAAIARFEPPARAAWLAKWAIVLVVVPALGLGAWTALGALGDGFPPQSAMDVPMLVLAPLGAYLGASIFLAIPVWLWVKFVALLGWALGRYVDRRPNPLRVTLDRASRREERAKTSYNVIGKLVRLRQRLFPDDRPRRIWVVGATALIVAEVLAEIFGRRRSLDFRGLVPFGKSLLLVMGLHVGFYMVGIFMLTVIRHVLGWSLGHLTRPPALFGPARLPPVLDDALTRRWTPGREEVIGRADPLTDEERAAIARHGPRTNEPERADLAAPFSEEPCLAFRVAGECAEQPLDDADAISFAVVTTEGRRVVVHVADVVVLFPARGEVYREGGDDFLKLRGLPRGAIAAREGRITRGDRVRVLGHLERVAVAGGGYREQKRLEILDAGDGHPVLVDVPAGVIW
jgi:hypothetical protein